MGLGGFGGAGPEGPPNVTEGAGQAPPPTGCLRPYSLQNSRDLYDPTRALLLCSTTCSARNVTEHTSASSKRFTWAKPS